MVSVILEHRNTAEGMTIKVPAEWPYWRLYRYVRENYPQWCFVESF